MANGSFQADDDPAQLSLVTEPILRLLATTEGPLTYSCVAPGSGIRVGINRDLDSLLDGLDNCPGNVNDAQTDTDMDGLGDACDPTPVPEPTLFAGLAVGVLALSRLKPARLERTRTRRRVRDWRAAGRAIRSLH